MKKDKNEFGFSAYVKYLFSQLFSIIYDIIVAVVVLAIIPFVFLVSVFNYIFGNEESYTVDNLLSDVSEDRKAARYYSLAEGLGIKDDSSERLDTSIEIFKNTVDMAERLDTTLKALKCYQKVVHEAVENGQIPRESLEFICKDLRKETGYPDQGVTNKDLSVTNKVQGVNSKQG